ncbi:MAG: tryptophan synthase subunit alpha [Tannerellaceae bacterium]|jgi:tryptophan synthase alpha chain|nr:tryptophan synthase subunit alpha [Tannerellaceae bacterium]
MNRIDNLFKSKPRNILSVYFTAGFPALGDTARILRALQSGGVDMAEIGIPFSDPMADGPVIQQSSGRALLNGMSLRLLFDQLADIRSEIRIPLVMMGYLNPIMQYGFEAFCRQCASTGVDGLIIPDLPFADYLADYRPTAERYGIRIIMLITPETSEERIRLIDRHTGGFIYMVSSPSVTGAKSSFDASAQSYFSRIAAMKLSNPCLVGFGVGNRATSRAACSHSAGVIVGSRFIHHLQSAPSIEEAVGRLLSDLEWK